MYYVGMRECYNIFVSTSIKRKRDERFFLNNSYVLSSIRGAYLMSLSMVGPIAGSYDKSPEDNAVTIFYNNK